MKKFISRAIVLIFVVTILCSVLMRGVFDRIRDKILTGFDVTADIINATLVDVFEHIEIDTDGVNFELLGGSLSEAIDVTAAGFEQKSYDFDLDLSHSLDIDVRNCDIVIASGDYDSIRVDVLENEDFTYTFSVVDGTLVIGDSQKSAEQVKLGPISLGSKERAVTYTGLAMVIGLPSEFVGEIKLATTNGDLKLGNLKLDERLIASTTNGKLALSNIEAYDILASSTNGRADVETLSATEIEISTTNDRITLTDLTAKRLSVTTSNASIDFSRLFGEKLSFVTTQGDINGSVLGAQSLYSIATLTDRTAIPTSKDNPRSQYKLDAKTVGGDIAIRFTE